MSTTTLEEARTHDLGGDVRQAHVLVATGAGGVGKTTIAAALGVAGARAGRRTLVLTIDPARRLAQALGAEALGNEPRRLEVDLDGGGGELWAMMLDMKRTFDEVVEQHAPSRERAEAIRDNRVYQTLSSTLSGTQEYMAMEKLHALHEQGAWELLVVDTPPTRNALDFLDAPRRLTDFLEGRLLQILVKPGLVAGKGLGRMVGMSTQTFMRVASRVTGLKLLEELAEFFRNFEGMYEGFKQRAAEVRSLLGQASSKFVVVASPQPPPLREARFFLERLEQEGLHTAGLVVNRVHPDCDAVGTGPCPEADDLRAAAGAQKDDPGGRAAAGSLRLLADISNLAARERRDVAAALYGVVPPAVVEVPLLDSDVHDLAALRTIAGALGG